MTLQIPTTTRVVFESHNNRASWRNDGARATINTSPDNRSQP